MNIGEKIAHFFSQKLGLYTKKEIFRTCEAIGKDVADLVNNFGDYNINSFIGIIKKHAPKIDIKICQDINIIRELGIKAGEDIALIDESLILLEKINVNGVSFSLGKGKNKISGIYLSKNSDNVASILAHEMEHHLFYNNSFVSKIIPNNILERNSSLFLVDKFTDSFIDNLSKNQHLFRKEILNGNRNELIEAFSIKKLCDDSFKNNGKYGILDVLATKIHLKDEGRAYNLTSRIDNYRVGEDLNLKNNNKKYSILYETANSVINKSLPSYIF